MRHLDSKTPESEIFTEDAISTYRVDEKGDWRNPSEKDAIRYECLMMTFHDSRKEEREEGKVTERYKGRSPVLQPLVFTRYSTF
ncbi:unnamed protein product [Lasius platythorax]|uniref:Uncharacterized protein n=1 Tax=Lasius platythorax TaxID=488582 RepID=A0AAV2NS62_9HYME